MGFFRNVYARLTRKSASDVIRAGERSVSLLVPEGKIPEYSPNKEVELYKSWCYTCANKNARRIASTPLRLYATRAKGEQPAGVPFGRSIGKSVKDRDRLEHLRATVKAGRAAARLATAEDVEEIAEHPILDLLDKPNERDNQFDLSELLSLFLDQTGDHFWYIQKGALGVPDWLWPLPSQLVRIVLNDRGELQHYLYGERQNRIKIPPENVIHFRRPHLKDQWYGMSVIEGAWWAVTGQEAIEKYEQRMIGNYGLQTIAVSYKDQMLSPQQRRAAQAEWGNALSRSAKEGWPLVNDGTVELKPVEWSPRELGFLNGRMWRKSEIINAYGQHEAMYERQASFANIEGAIFLWLSGEISSTLRRVEHKLNDSFVTLWNEPRLFLSFDDVVPDDIEFNLKLAESDLKNAVRTINEVRQERGLDPVPWGDEPLVAMTPISFGDGSEGEEESAGEEERLADEEERGGKTREPAPSRDIRVSGSSSPSAGLPPPILEKTEGGIYIVKAPIGRATPNQRTLGRIVKSWFKSLDAKVRQEARQSKVNPRFSFVEDEVAIRSLAVPASKVLGREIVAGFGRGARKLGMGVSPYVRRPEAQEFVKQHSYRFAQSLGKHVAHRLRETMRDGLAEGLSTDELADKIEEAWSGWSGWKSEMIARTESARALVAGEEMQWRQTEVVEAKQWSAALDACEFCLAMDGKIIDLGEDYIPLGGSAEAENEKGETIRLEQNYTAVAGPPLHPACRCDLLPVLKEKYR